ncbi:MAG: GTPase HflX [Myxococcota bacterium]
MQFHSSPIEEHDEAPLADEGRWEDVVAQWTRRKRLRQPHEGINHSYVVSVDIGDVAPSRARLQEICALVDAQGDVVAGAEVCRVAKADPRTLLGRGAYESIAARAEQCAADMLVIDACLSPSQARNLEDAMGIAVCDREAVILNVFLRHARTRKARIQVEIAHLEYLRPRIRGLGLVMDQQAGGIMRGRGPGETASELMARHLDARLAELRKAFHKIRNTSVVQRKTRAGCRRIAFVGYTNAGKTTLMNALTNAELSARDQPFETLDTTSRCLTRHGGDVLLSDTVGFIRRLPDRLLASFESTLAEIRDASMLAIVVDTSDSEWPMHVNTTHALLQKLDAEQIPRLYVFNKMDRLASSPAPELLQRHAGDHPFVCVSGHDQNDVERLRLLLIDRVRADRRPARVFVPYTATRAMALVHANCRVAMSQPNQRGVRFTLEAEPHVIQRIRREVEEACS